MRLNQYISHNTQYSRREADKLIKEGRISINKKIITDFSYNVENEENVYLDNKKIKEKNEYEVVVYNKPKGELVSKKDDRGRDTIYNSLSKRFSNFIPVGRLDYASEGLLLLSDSPKIVRALMESSLERVYLIKVSGKLTDKIFDAMESGLTLEDARAGGHKNSKIESMEFAPFSGYWVIKNGKYSKIKVAIQEGKNRELRRFFAHFNLQVLDLKRISYGFIALNNLPTKKSRFLTRQEYNKLREFIKDNNKDIS